MYPTPTLACNDGNWKISPHQPSRKAQQELIKKVSPLLVQLSESVLRLESGFVIKSNQNQCTK